MAEREIVDEGTEGEDVENEAGEEEEGKDPYEGLTEEQLKERLTKAEKLIVKNKTTTKPKAPITTQPEGDKPQWAIDAELRETKRDFAEEHNLTKAQTEAVFRYNGGTAPDEETLALPEVQAMIKALGSKERVAANTPRGSKAPVYKGKTFGEIATDKDATKDDKSAAFAATAKRHGVA